MEKIQIKLNILLDRLMGSGANSISTDVWLEDKVWLDKKISLINRGILPRKVDLMYANTLWKRYEQA